jgi:non-ribosomal peptide synthetase component F
MYITFTSGTTGVPKGITTEHSAFYSMAMANGKALQFMNPERSLRRSSSEGMQMHPPNMRVISMSRLLTSNVHSAFYSMAMANGKALQVGPATRMLQFASYTFDVSLKART